MRHSISVVIPVYKGEATLRPVVDELLAQRTIKNLELGIESFISEIILVHDCGPDDSASTIRALVAQYECVQAVWLSRNFGQHAATLAGIAASTGDWIVTMDEDGQHDPRSIGAMLASALDRRLHVVYALGSNRPPHSFVRNLASRTIKVRLIQLITGGEVTNFSSYRLILGSLGRTLAAYASSNVFLDVAISWISQSIGFTSTELRRELRTESGYSTKKLVVHFGRLLLSAGTRPLRLGSLLGFTSFLAGLVCAVVIVALRATQGVAITGWASLMTLFLILGGITQLLLGLVAEYLGIVVRSSLGRPVYVATDDPSSSPHLALSHNKQDEAG